MMIFFYLFATLLTASSIFVIVSKNPVYSVLWLIFAFCNGCGLLLLIGAEFLAMMLIIIYVGAVSVLFLFVVMMLDVDIDALKHDIRKNLLLGVIVSVIMFTDLVLIISIGTKSVNITNPYIPINPTTINPTISNVNAIGNVLYTDFMLPFQTAGIILFVAMISCIALTLRKRVGVKRQNKHRQLVQSKKNITLLGLDAKSGIEGIKYE